MSVFEIPLISANQRFSISLTGNQYILAVKWCPPAQCWMIDISDIDGVPVLLGIPMITGIDLLEQYEYIGIRGSLVVQTDFDPFVVPNFDSLGKTGHLYFLT